MPSTTMAPGPSMEPPFALTSFTVSNGRLVSNSHMIDPSLAEYARMPPSAEPEKTTPGMVVNAADCAVLHTEAPAQSGCFGGVYQTRSPVSRRTAWIPPGAGVL